MSNTEDFKHFILQRDKKTQRLVNIGIWSESEQCYIDDNGTVSKEFEKDVYDYELLTFSDMRMHFLKMELR